jgi:hypothetical protein
MTAGGAAAKTNAAEVKVSAAASDHSAAASRDSAVSRIPQQASTRAAAATTARAARQQQPARELDSSRLQAQKYFTIIDLSGSKAVEIGTTLTWREGQLLRPAADSTSSPSDWKLVKVEARGHQKSDTGRVTSWVTTCGYLQWAKSSREVQYTAEVDGCSVSGVVGCCSFARGSATNGHCCLLDISCPSYTLLRWRAARVWSCTLL